MSLLLALLGAAPAADVYPPDDLVWPDDDVAFDFDLTGTQVFDVAPVVAAFDFFDAPSTEWPDDEIAADALPDQIFDDFPHVIDAGIVEWVDDPDPQPDEIGLVFDDFPHVIDGGAVDWPDDPDPAPEEAGIVFDDFGHVLDVIVIDWPVEDDVSTAILADIFIDAPAPAAADVFDALIIDWPDDDPLIAFADVEPIPFLADILGTLSITEADDTLLAVGTLQQEIPGLMVSSVTDIVNIALGRAQCGRIVSYDTDVLKEAQRARDVYDNTRDAMLRTHLWNFSRTQVQLASVVPDTALFGYQYAYALPADFMRLIALTSDGSYDGRTPYKMQTILVSGAYARVALCDTPTAYLWYVRQGTVVNLFDPLFVEAFTWNLAADFSLSLKESSSQAEFCRKEFRAAMVTARSANGVEDWPDEFPDGTWTTDRSTDSWDGGW